MPIIKSAKKRMKQTAVRRARNQNTKRSLRSELKTFNAAIESKDTAKATTAYVKVQSNLDKSVKKGLLKKNTAARKLSRLSAQLKALGAKPVKAKKAAKATTKPSVSTKSKKAPTKKTPAKTATKKAPAKK